MTTESLSATDISQMDYSRFVGLVRERNRPSGGVRTVHEVGVHARIGPDSRVLEIGSNTGFTSVNLALLTGASVMGIDINPDSVAEARRYAAEQGVADRVEFRVDDGCGLALQDASFDAVWVSNVVSFVADKLSMLNEVKRVLAVGGTLIAVPIYYVDHPAQDLVDEVSTAIGTRVDVMTKSAWRSFFESSDLGGALELYYESDFVYEFRGEDDVAQYCEYLMSKEHLLSYDESTREELLGRMSYFMNLFNRNLSHAGFSILLFQKRAVQEEIELFVSRSASRQPTRQSGS